MACNDCTECTKVTTTIPECYEGVIVLGTIADTGQSIDIEIIKLSNDYRVEASDTSSGAGVVTITLSQFTDVNQTFWRKDGNGYKVTIYSADDRSVYPILDGASTSATCLLLDFIRGDTDIENDITIVYSA